MTRSFAIGFAGLLTIVGSFHDRLVADDTVDFSRQVLPILSNKCFVCHGPDDHPDTDLKLNSLESAMADLGGYQAINPKKPSESAVLERIHSTDDPMPPEDAEKQLTEKEREILSKWVRQGGEYSLHWAYVVPKKVAPKTKSEQSPAAIVDAFVEDQLKAKSLQLAKPAEKSILARRVSLVLTGLPPDPELLKSYMADASDQAYERLVDQLLKSKAFGEHQARYWLDAVRYGDTHGLHLDNRRGIFPYRDWVIKAFNDNLPLDDFVTWQLAGDLLEDPTLEQLVATGYVRMNPSTAEGGAIAAEFQAKNNFDRTENLGTVFLGMSLICARCHSHKYDPISQQEYYRLLAFFNSTAESPLDGNSYTYGPTVKAPSSQSDWGKWQAFFDQEKALINAANSIIGDDQVDAKDLELWTKSNRVKRLELIAKPLKAFEKSELIAKAKTLQKERAELEKSFTTTLVAKELPKPRATRLLHRGEYNEPKGDPLDPAVVSVAGGLPEKAQANRLGLAKWLLAEQNPLTSRVLVNRIWQRVFGEGIVRTPEDFGLQGQQPTHPELLDWLAVDLRESDWDFKRMLKVLVMSRTFRQNSAWRTDVDDPENRLFARGPSYRLDAEVLRDIALWGSGLMVDERGGEGIKPYQPAGMWKALAHPASNTKQYKADSGERLYRRSIYVYWKRTSPHPMMTLFDAPSRETSCVRRSRTNTSLQSLGLFNETQRIEMARKFAERLIKEKANDAERLNWLFQIVVSRAPNEVETKVCLDLLKKMQTRYTATPADATSLLKTGEAGSDKELNAVEVAAWAQVIVTVLASDVAILLY